MSHTRGWHQASGFTSDSLAQPPPYRVRALCRAIQLGFAIGAATAASQAIADCAIVGTSVTTPTTNTGDCSIASQLLVGASLTNEGSITTLPGARLTNKSSIINHGLLATAGQFDGGGLLSNTGVFRVDERGSATVNTSNLGVGRLIGGTWEVVAGDRKASLFLTGGTIDANEASILLSGVDSSFTNIDALGRNEGSLTIQGGRGYVVQTKLVNRGSLNVRTGGTLTIAGLLQNDGLIDVVEGEINGKGLLRNAGTLRVADGKVIVASDNLVNGTLTGGRWIVESSSPLGASLRVGVNNITTNAADIALIGADASFAQLDALTRNEGRLFVEHHFHNFRAPLVTNSGEIAVGAGGFVQVPGKLRNDGTITNHGVIAVKGGEIAGGILDNNGAITVGAAGLKVESFVHVDRSANLVNGTLSGGHWVVIGTDNKANLGIGTGAIHTNKATVSLVGALAFFDQLSGLRRNQGALTFESGRIDRLGDVNEGFENVGSVEVLDSSLTVSHSSDVVNGTLLHGAWSVIANSSSDAELILGTEFITRNEGNVSLFGANARFDQLNTLERNNGTLIIGQGRIFSLSRNLENSGAIAVGGGARLTGKGTLINNGTLLISNATVSAGEITNTGEITVNGLLTAERSSNVAGDSLTGGRWIVRSTDSARGTLVLGTRNILQNAADVELDGANAEFAQINRLEHNTGSLTLLNGKLFETSKSKFINDGVLRVGTGSTLRMAAPLQNHGLLEVSGKLDGGGELRNEGTLRIVNANVNLTNVREFVGNSELTGGTWEVVSTEDLLNTEFSIGTGEIRTNRATVRLSGRGAHWDQLSGLQLNAGALSVVNGSSYATASKLNNSGRFTVSTGARVSNKGDLVNTGELAIVTGGSLLGPGTLTLDDGSLRVDGRVAQGVVHVRGGTLRGSGILDTDVLQQAGTLNPGNSPGTLRIDGDYTMSGGELRIEVQGVAEADFDHLVVGGVANFTGGQLVFDFTGFTAPSQPSYRFDFLDAPSIVGLDALALSFVGLKPGFDFALDTTQGAITLSGLQPNPVPVPAACWLFAPAMMLLGRFRRTASQASASSVMR